MMEKAIKQRLLGGVVLVAGAVLFLPVLLDGSGASLTIPPLPKAPEVSGVEAMAPQLDQKVAETEQAVDAAHAGRDEAQAEASAPVAGEGGDVAPDAAALAGGDTAAATAPAVSAKPVAATAATSTTAAAAAKAAATPPAAAAAKPAAPAAVPAKPAVTTPVPAKPLPMPAPVAATAPAKPVAPAVTASAKPVAKEAPAAKPGTDKALPAAWLVQVGVFSSRDKAQSLVQQLRRKGYAAVLSPQGGAFKVVVGPELNRSVADSIKARLAADPELRLNGWVQAYKP